MRPQRDLGEITEEVREAAKRPGPGRALFCMVGDVNSQKFLSRAAVSSDLYFNSIPLATE